MGLSMLLFRLIASLGAVIAGLLIWRIVNHWEQDRANQGLILWLWSPLVILESALSGHNDSILMAVSLAGVALLLSRRYGGERDRVCCGRCRQGQRAARITADADWNLARVEGRGDAGGTRWPFDLDSGS